METGQANSNAQVMRFSMAKRIELEAECVEAAFDEFRDIQCYALLNNAIVMLDGQFNQSYRVAHAGDKKINRLKLNDGLICITGEDNAVTFYDSKSDKAVKRIPCSIF